MMNAQMLTPAQVAERLQVGEHTVHGWLRRGALRGVKLGRLWRVAPDDLDAFLRDHANGDNGDFDEPLTAEEATESDAAWRAYLAGDDPGESLDEVRRALRGEQRVGA